jgi:lipopolysaccharide transport system permease protein
MAVMIAALGLVFGLIFGTPMEVFLPYLASGIIMWGLIAGILNDGAQAFIQAEGMIKQIPLSHLTHLIRVVWRNVLTTAHNIVIFPLVLLAVGAPLTWTILLWPLGVMIAVIGTSGLALFLALLSTRFRDFPPIINSLVTIGFYVTPVIWMPSSLGDKDLAHLLLGLNPFYHLLQIARLPLLGELPTWQNWVIALAVALLFWTIGLGAYKKLKNRIAYWV